MMTSVLLVANTSTMPFCPTPTTIAAFTIVPLGEFSVAVSGRGPVGYTVR
jgi:hypothetical protein